MDCKLDYIIESVLIFLGVIKVFLFCRKMSLFSGNTH